MPLQSPFKPNLWRLLLGFVLAPIAGAALFALFEGADLGVIVPAMLYVGIPATIVLGIPAYFVFRNWLEPRIATVMIAGGIIAICPLVLLFSLGGPEHGEVGNCVTNLNGQMTWCGFLGALRVLAEVFAYGAFGGLVFWICVVWRHEQFEDTSDVKI